MKTNKEWIKFLKTQMMLPFGEQSLYEVLEFLKERILAGDPLPPDSILPYVVIEAEMYAKLFYELDQSGPTDMVSLDLILKN